MLVDDHQIIRDGIKQLLDGEGQINVAMEAVNVDEAIKQLQYTQPHVVITDLSMPNKNGFDLLQHITENYPKIGVIVLSMHIEDIYIKKAISLGVKGYLPKDISKYQLIEAVFQVHQGEKYFSNQVTQVLMNDLLKNDKGGSETERLQKLTQREKEIIDLIMEGISSSQIADRLFISTRTVENHRANIMNKLEVRNTIELVKFIMENRSFQGGLSGAGG